VPGLSGRQGTHSQRDSDASVQRNPPQQPASSVSIHIQLDAKLNSPAAHRRN
jgi:hypothetical protein